MLTPTINGPLQINTTTTPEMTTQMTMLRKGGKQLAANETSQQSLANHDPFPWVPQEARKPRSQKHGPAQAIKQPKAPDLMCALTTLLTDHSPHLPDE